MTLHTLKPIATFLMTTFNGAQYVGAAVQSIIAQSDPRWKLIIVDDASSDHTNRVLDTFRDDRISVVPLKKNRGQTGALNLGLTLIDTKWIIRIDQDDLCEPQRLATLLELTNTHPAGVLFGSGAKLINVEGDPIGYFRPPAEDNLIRSSLIDRPYANPFVHSAVMYDSTAARMVGGYPEEIIVANDFGLWIRLMRLGSMHQSTKFLCSLRIHPGQYSGDRSVGLTAFREVLKMSETFDADFVMDKYEVKRWRGGRIRVTTNVAFQNLFFLRENKNLVRDFYALFYELSKEPSEFAHVVKECFRALKYRGRPDPNSFVQLLKNIV